MAKKSDKKGGEEEERSTASSQQRKPQRQWRFYKTKNGNTPVRKFLDGLTTEDRAEVLAEMTLVKQQGRSRARHLGADLYEVRVDCAHVIYRVLFAALGRYDHVLLAVHAFVKKSQKTPKKEVEVADKRLKEWIARGAQLKREAKEKKKRR